MSANAESKNWTTLIHIFLRTYLLEQIYFVFCVFRPPDIVCRRTYVFPPILSFFFLSFLSPPNLRGERNSTKIGHMLGSNCDLKTHVQNLGYPLPLQIGPIGDPKPPFWTTSQLNGNFNGIYLRSRTGCR